jgi:hypothetical protein
MALVTAENMYIRADPVYKYCMNWVSGDTVVQKSLGDGLKPGGLRSYRLDSGKIEMLGTKPIWRPPRIQVCLHWLFEWKESSSIILIYN